MQMLNTYCCVVGNMKKWKPIGITALEYKEYRQNGCIRVKDYPAPSKKEFDPKHEPVKFNIYEVLDFDEDRSRYILRSFSFGEFRVTRTYEGYEIEIMDESKRPLVMRRLKNFGLNPEYDKETGLIYADKI